MQSTTHSLPIRVGHPHAVDPISTLDITDVFEPEEGYFIKWKLFKFFEVWSAFLACYRLFLKHIKTFPLHVFLGLTYERRFFFDIKFLPQLNNLIILLIKCFDDAFLALDLPSHLCKLECLSGGFQVVLGRRHIGEKHRV